MTVRVFDWLGYKDSNLNSLLHRTTAQRWLKDGQGSLIDGSIKLGRQLIGLPQRLDGVLNQLEQGQLRGDMRRLERQLQRMEATQRRRDMLIVALLLVVGYFVWR